MTKCGHGVWPGEYCDPCERDAQDAAEVQATRVSHDQTPVLRLSGDWVDCGETGAPPRMEA